MNTILWTLLLILLRVDIIISTEKITNLEYQNTAAELQKRFAQKNYDPNMQVDSVVEVSVNGVPHYGLIRWIGVVEVSNTKDLIAGLELVSFIMFFD